METDPVADPPFFQSVSWNREGLVPAIAQDAANGEVLMMAWMNRQALRLTLESSRVHYFSRSRDRIWLKGESSGHIQEVESIHLDCDGDVLLIKVKQVGGACHEGFRSCFFRRVDARGGLVVDGQTVFDVAQVYSP